MLYLSVVETANKWSMSPRRVQVLCNEGRIAGAQKVGCVWMIPEIAEKPLDGRKKLNNSSTPSAKKIYIERSWAMPNKNTFEIKPIRELINQELTDGVWIDPFANRNKFATITNDLNPAYDTNYHLDALDFMRIFENNSVDGVLYDPPYSPRQVSECYNDVGYNVTWDTTKASFWGNHKREISRIVKIGGKVITFGWNSGGIGNKYGFEITRILMVPHGGWHNDTICTVEIKTHEPDEKSFLKELIDMKEKVKIKTYNPVQQDQLLIEKLQSLPVDYWDFKESDVKEYTHGLHSYPAMMVCPISRNIIKIVQSIRPIESLADPFMGSGTVLVEGMLAGINKIYGNDINPLALFLSKVKTTCIDISKLQSEAEKLYARISEKFTSMDLQIENADDIMRHVYGLDLTDKNDWGMDAPKFLLKYTKENNLDIEIPTFKNIGYWFKPRVILLLSLIKSEVCIIQDESIKAFIFTAFSEAIRFVSNRRNGEFKLFRMPPKKVDEFTPDVIQEFKTILDRNIEKMNAFVEACADSDTKSSVTIVNNDAMVLSDIPDDSIDLVITSPPYGDSRTTVAYGEYSRLSLQWIDIFNLSEKEIMQIDKSLMGGIKFRNGFEYDIPSAELHNALEKIKDRDIERAGDVYSFYHDLAQSIQTISRKMRKDGYLFWVVGNRTVKGITLQTDKIIAEIGESYGLINLYTIDRNIINKVMPSLNSPSNETGVKSATMTNEHIVVLRKL